MNLCGANSLRVIRIASDLRVIRICEYIITFSHRAPWRSRFKPESAERATFILHEGLGLSQEAVNRSRRSMYRRVTAC